MSKTFLVLTVLVGCATAQAHYDLLLQGGHVIDAKNNLSAGRDVAIKDGKIAAVGPHIANGEAGKTIDVSGFYVTPGLVDIHVHAYAGTGTREHYSGWRIRSTTGCTVYSGRT